MSLTTPCTHEIPRSIAELMSGAVLVQRYGGSTEKSTQTVRCWWCREMIGPYPFRLVWWPCDELGFAHPWHLCEVCSRGFAGAAA